MRYLEGEKIIEDLGSLIGEYTEKLIQQIKIDYGIRFLTTTKLDIFDDGNPFDRSGELLDTGEIYEESSFRSFLDFLENSYTGGWTPTYESGCGKSYDKNEKEVQDRIESWMYKVFNAVLKHLLGDAIDYLEVDEINDLIYDAIHIRSCEIYEKLDKVDLKEVLEIARNTMNNDQYKAYEQLKKSHKLLQFIKSLDHAKLLTVTSKGHAYTFEINRKNHMVGTFRTNRNTYQKEFINLMMLPEAVVIVRNIIPARGKQPMQVVYGFQNINDRLVTIPKKQLEEAYDEKLDNETFAEYYL